MTANLPRRLAAEVVGAVLGVWTAHLMFGERLFMMSLHARLGPRRC